MIYVQHDDQKITHVRIRFAEARAAIDRRLERSIRSAVLSLAAVESASRSGLKSEQIAEFSVGLVQPPKVAFDSVQQHREWLVSLVFRESVESLWEIVEAVWCTAEYAKRRLSGEEFLLPDNPEELPTSTHLLKAAIGRRWTEFDMSGLPKKLKSLERDFGINASWCDEVVSISRARAILTHRAGVVGPTDLVQVDFDGGRKQYELKMIGLRMQGKVDGGGADFWDLQPGGITVGPTSLRLELLRELTRKYDAGEPLSLSFQDANDAWYTSLRFCVSLLESLERQISTWQTR
ncbi:MAG: hypothetical protein R3B57_08190 [Phycisphaerales bacterium]